MHDEQAQQKGAPRTASVLQEATEALSGAAQQRRSLVPSACVIQEGAQRAAAHLPVMPHVVHALRALQAQLRYVAALVPLRLRVCTPPFST